MIVKYTQQNSASEIICFERLGKSQQLEVIHWIRQGGQVSECVVLSL